MTGSSTFDSAETVRGMVERDQSKGVKDGEMVAEGTPEKVVEAPESFTGRYLAPLLGLEVVAAA
ncbi:hypothetical protein LL253_10315 [Sphingobium soli]|jgi:excinuclease ABC subunit A|uniref:Uncharacterized protein n=1 Tax=Sphingobium soli TaxID=1591116 RepID=A0ABS8H3G1_9SPHN|nr:hypothetical protein [Sphingobium soli]MCC4233082.1 hypothetical protein [Sphingobium soli]